MILIVLCWSIESLLSLYLLNIDLNYYYEAVMAMYCWSTFNNYERFYCGLSLLRNRWPVWFVIRTCHATDYSCYSFSDSYLVRCYNCVVPHFLSTLSHTSHTYFLAKSVASSLLAKLFVAATIYDRFGVANCSTNQTNYGCHKKHGSKIEGTLMISFGTKISL